ncbi:MAG: carboxypeptidase-like regulatory domain-containing protein [Ignavibacteriaceae bacterium]|nr:carboxypeptidase-like regulatory domain-containing protein [Ignavibacteriaceae bacterium]
MKNFFSIIFVILLSTTLFSQTQFIPDNSPDIALAREKRTDANIVGHTVDKLSKEHIGFITIRIKGTTIGAATDATGHYTMRNLPAGDFIVVASGVGYKSVEKQVKLSRGTTLEINFELEEDAVLLDNVVVSANRNETKRREASNIVNVVTGKLFDNTNSVCLAQGLNFQPGLRVENNCQNCGFQQVRINGLEGPYSQILIDSRPIFSALAGVYGIEQIPVNMIDRVEVVRGGGSALFGSNAIAGTINIITKEPMNNAMTVSNSTMFIAGSSADVNTSVNAALVSEDYQSGVSIYGSTRQRESWDANGDGFTEIGEINARNLGFRSYFKTSKQSKLTAEYHNLGEFRRGGNKLNVPAHQSDITEQTNHNINSGGIKCL